MTTEKQLKFDQRYLEMARIWAQNSYCQRRQVGALVVKNGMIISGKSPDGLLPEIVERPDHPWFIGVQFHPELKSKPFAPHPLFVSLVKAAEATAFKKENQLKCA